MFCVAETKEVVAKIPPRRVLIDRRLSVIRHSVKSLCELIPSNDRFIETLYDKKCLTETQMKEILSEQTVTDRNTRILDIMRDTSISDYDKIVDEVDGSNLHYLANLLKNGGGQSHWYMFSIFFSNLFQTVVTECMWIPVNTDLGIQQSLLQCVILSCTQTYTTYRKLFGYYCLLVVILMAKQ